jgi:hypothetical protein
MSVDAADQVTLPPIGGTRRELAEINLADTERAVWRHLADLEPRGRV